MAALAEFSVLPERAKAFGKFRDLVSVTVPNVEFRGEATKEIRSPVYLQFSRTILTLRGTLHISAKIKGQKLQPVANPENWHTQLVDILVEHGSIGRVNARRTTRKDNSFRRSVSNRRASSPKWKDLGIDATFAHSSGDHLRILRAKIKNDDFVLG